MACIAAYIRDPASRNGAIGEVHKGCEITVSGNVLTVGDKTGGQLFTQELECDKDFDVFDDFITDTPDESTSRMISLCSESSVFSPEEIRDNCVKFVRYFLPEDSSNDERRFSISAGLVLNDGVKDFMSLSNKTAKKFEAIPVQQVEEAVDLIRTSLDGMKKLRESLFVLRISCQNYFFEWVIIPKVDTYIEGSTFGTLPTCHKVLFAIKKVNSINPQGFEHFRNSCAAFRLISDSFVDVDTQWVGHFDENSKLLSNASIIKFLKCARAFEDRGFAPKKSELFQEYQGTGLNDSDDEDADDEIRKELERLGEEEVKLEELTVPEEKEEIPEEEEEIIEKQQVEEEEEEHNEESKVEEEEEDAELRESRLAEEEMKRRLHQEEEEEEDRLRRLKEIRDSRKRKSPKQKKQEINHSMKDGSSTYSRISQRNKLVERLEKLHAIEEEEEDINDEEEPKVNDAHKKKELTPIQKRQKKLDKQRLLIFRCLKAINDPNATEKYLTDLNNELQEELVKSREFRETVQEQIIEVRDELVEKRKKAAESEKLVKDYTSLYLEAHNELVQRDFKENAMAKRNKNSSPAQVASKKHPEYDQAIALLTKEKERLRKEVELLKKKAKSIEKE